MSYKCAEKLGILHLVDERFAGVAVGVGESKILGKVRAALIVPRMKLFAYPLCFSNCRFLSDAFRENRSTSPT